MIIHTPDIIINDLKYSCFLNYIKENYQELIISGNGNQYKCNSIDYDKTFNILWIAINYTNKDIGIYCSYKFENNENLTINVNNTILELNINFILKKIENETPLSDVILNKIKKLEDSETKIYPLKDKFLGPCVMINNESYMKLDYVYDKLNHIYHKLDEIYKSKSDYKHSKYNLFESNLFKKLGIYYNVNRIFQDKIPICSENQFFFNGIKKSNIYHDNIDIDNVYTVFTKKYENDIVGIIKKDDDKIEINFNVYINYKNILFDVDPNYYYVLKEDFFKFGYILEFPFDINDGVYISYIRNKIFPHIEIVPYIIKSNKLYNVKYLKSEKVVIDYLNIVSDIPDNLIIEL